MRNTAGANYGYRAAHMQFGFVIATHLFQEFNPEIKRMWPVSKIVKRQPTGKSGQE
jgi:hypothetical protein